MLVIRPAALARDRRRRPLLLGVEHARQRRAGSRAGGCSATARPLPRPGVMASAAAIGLGVGAAWLVRVSCAQPDAVRRGAARSPCWHPRSMTRYTLVLSPRLPIRDAARLDGLLVGPAGVRALTVRDWEGRYRVRGRSLGVPRRSAGAAGSAAAPIRATTPPPSARASLAGLRRPGCRNVPVRGAVAFPLKRSRIALEEPDDEIVTADNGPWWANAIGRARRLDPAAGASFVAAVLDAADTPATEAAAPTADPRAGRLGPGTRREHRPRGATPRPCARPARRPAARPVAHRPRRGGSARGTD